MKTNAKLASTCSREIFDSEASLHTGLGTDLLTTSMAPRGDMMSGRETGQFTTSMIGGHDALDGEATGLFTTSM